MTNLNKTIINQLLNSYIDCSYSNSDNTVVVNIETPDPDGNDNLRLPFTIRTKDGYALKYDKTGNVVFRFPNSTFKESLDESELTNNYNNYFSEYTFNLSNLSSYKNDDPVTDYNPPTYRQDKEGNKIYIPLFEYSDIATQKENIFIFDTGIKIKSKPIYIISYYGKDPNRCKLDLAIEVFSNPYGATSFEMKTQSGRMFKRYKMGLRYGVKTVSYTGVTLPGHAIPEVVSISVNAEKVGEVVEEDSTDGLFTTYVVNQSDLKKITDDGTINNEIIINTFSYPIKFDDNNLLETDIVLGNTPTKQKAKRFKIPEPKIKIFSFNVPYLKDVENCKLLLPFNTEITLDYDIIRGKVISGYIQYEVSTNSSTLYIDNGDVEFYKDNIVIETSVPYKPTGEYSNFKEVTKRLGKQIPTLIIKCLQEEKQHHFIQGKIDFPIANILKDELTMLNQELERGVIVNE